MYYTKLSYVKYVFTAQSIPSINCGVTRIYLISVGYMFEKVYVDNNRYCRLAAAGQHRHCIHHLNKQTTKHIKRIKWQTLTPQMLSLIQ